MREPLKTGVLSFIASAYLTWLVCTKNKPVKGLDDDQYALVRIKYSPIPLQGIEPCHEVAYRNYPIKCICRKHAADW